MVDDFAALFLGYPRRPQRCRGGYCGQPLVSHADRWLPYRYIFSQPAADAKRDFLGVFDTFRAVALQIAGQAYYYLYRLVLVNELQNAVDIAFIAVFEPGFASDGLDRKRQLGVVVRDRDTDAYGAYI